MEKRGGFIHPRSCSVTETDSALRHVHTFCHTSFSRLWLPPLTLPTSSHHPLATRTTGTQHVSSTLSGRPPLPYPWLFIFPHTDRHGVNSRCLDARSLMAKLCCGWDRSSPPCFDHRSSTDRVTDGHRVGPTAYSFHRQGKTEEAVRKRTWGEKKLHWYGVWKKKGQAVSNVLHFATWKAREAIPAEHECHSCRTLSERRWWIRRLVVSLAPGHRLHCVSQWPECLKNDLPQEHLWSFWGGSRHTKLFNTAPYVRDWLTDWPTILSPDVHFVWMC